MRSLANLGKKTMTLFSTMPWKGAGRDSADISPANPVWPLPRTENGLSAEQILREFAKYESWHYAYEFEGGISPALSHYQQSGLAGDLKRPLQRFRHFMPYVMKAAGGSLQGKRVLDIACNSGFWSVQFALLGADVVGFDARPELIEQANLIKSIVGLKNVRFHLLDFWDMSPQSLGGQFDIVLNLGILYHLPNTLQALQLTRAMAREHILLDTEVHPSEDSVVKLRWEQPDHIRSAARSGIVAVPSKSSVEMMLKDLGVAEWCAIPVRGDMPRDYLEHRRGSWLVKV
jgi:SAM-dependent methyltransferase